MIMKRCLCLLFALLVLSLPAFAQESSMASTDPAAHVPAPQLVCDAPDFDFGTMDNSQTCLLYTSDAADE